MAVTDPRSAHHDGELSVTGDLRHQRGRAARRPAARHRVTPPPWRRRALIGVGALVAAAVAVLGTLAGTYQPVQFGGETGVRFPGLPTATGSTFVNFWLPSLARGHSGAWDLCCRGV
jgi:hypothetical protein